MSEIQGAVNFSYSKAYGTAIYPVHAIATSGLFKRCEPILNPDQLKSRFLKGIPLFFPNGDTFSDDDLMDRIYLACNQVELDLKTTLTREQRQEKLPFKTKTTRRTFTSRLRKVR
jgi:hypothetical protein